MTNANGDIIAVERVGSRKVRTHWWRYMNARSVGGSPQKSRGGSLFEFGSY